MNIRQGFPGTHGSTFRDNFAPAKELDLLRVGQALWRGRRLIATLGIVGLVFGAVYGFGVARPKFAATALLVMTQTPDPVFSGDASSQPASQDVSDMNTQLHIIQSRALVQQMVDALALENDPEFNTALRPGWSIFSATRSDPSTINDAETAEQVIANVQGALSAYVQRSTRIFIVTAQSEDRFKAAKMANTLSAIYLQDQIDAKFQAANDAVSWLSDRVGVLRHDLIAQEAAVAQLRTQMGLTSAEGLAILNARLKEARARLQDVQQQAEQTNDQQRVALQKLALERSISELELAVQTQGADVNALQQLEREAQATRVLYETLLARLKEASAVRGLQQADARVLSAATAGTYQSPQKGLIMLIGALIGMVIASVYVLSKQFVHSGFRTADELAAAAGKPVLGQVPIIPVADRSALVPFLSNQPTAATAEAIRNLRTSLLMSNVEQPPQVVLIASAVSGEGKTTQAVALTQNFAGLGKRVLLIEGDIRRCTLEHYVPGPSAPGIMSLLAGDVSLSDAVQHDAQLGADVLFGEKTGLSAADLFASSRFERLIQEARADYDMIIIDSPPVLVVPDARVIARYADAILFIVGWNKTTRGQVAEGLRQFEMVNCAVTGFVLSQVKSAEMVRYGYADTNPAYTTYGEGYYGAT
ncbi:polysaccharide biosynthesis tyrosine autokinase [Aliiroseovarius sp. F47248L]|uniref:polysaccharide biosynthesis tyrosine autokinase n=1 Tax=Aliiroseovarius sp. F47248L TaxID=2926420 RepID=UPI001FF42402|nr:polysaccharide biosynthesis tyrosine autokinase [Aliiroseovarius sp. F47248L]MCK0139999.1 polysaccharide biosynthesis tyrosine autokinase [Aliiroseovarius sp. F47248L]